jgi:hypothetical protein
MSPKLTNTVVQRVPRMTHSSFSGIDNLLAGAHYPAFGLRKAGLPSLLHSLCSCLFLFGYHCTCNWYTNLSSLCVSGLVRSFASPFRVLIFSNKKRWWNIHLNSGFFYTIAMWKRNPINHVKEGFAVVILVFVSQLHQRFWDWWKKSEFSWVFLRQEIH